MISAEELPSAEDEDAFLCAKNEGYGRKPLHTSLSGRQKGGASVIRASSGSCHVLLVICIRLQIKILIF